jgi:CubicO group peptidase (beta-lactamase class C family)
MRTSIQRLRKPSVAVVAGVLALGTALVGAATPVVHRPVHLSASREGGRAQREGGMPRATPGAVGMATERLQNATALLRQFVVDHKIAGGVAAVARRGKIVYLEPVGLQSIETRAPMTERSLFRVYSMTKAVTAVAVMMLVEEGKLQLTDPAATYLPEFKSAIVQEGGAGAPRAPARAITIRDLLLHTSGLSHRTSELYRRLQVRSRSIALPQFVSNITKAPLMEDPGTRFRYSEATTVLGRVVEVVAGRSFDAFVNARILQPLGMSDTAFWVDGEARSRLATVYQRSQDGVVAPFEIEELPFTQKPALMEGAVGLVSTAEDFIRFGQMLLNKGELGGVRLLKPDTVASMTVNGLPDAILKERGGNIGWGLANVDVVVGAGSRGYLSAIGEYGWDGSAGTFFAVDPSRELVVTLMTQNLPANPDQLRQKFKAAILQSIVE